jgi:hypothetical protein
MWILDISGQMMMAATFGASAVLFLAQAGSKHGNEYRCHRQDGGRFGLRLRSAKMEAYGSHSARAFECYG